jgi:2-polyprenyl-3-methyl-5-hydroxy-6-metoxy-1,4-benzoquinol methylase
MAPDGVAIARKFYPKARFEVVAATDGILGRINEQPFDYVISTEVVEHVFDPHSWASACFDALKPGGKLVMSTPYHGFVKNLAISLTNKWDGHFHPLRTGGHIKFWSPATITRLLEFHGFERPRIIGAGRVPLLWKSMVVCVERSMAPKPKRDIQELWKADEAVS